MEYRRFGMILRDGGKQAERREGCSRRRLGRREEELCPGHPLRDSARPRVGKGQGFTLAQMVCSEYGRPYLGRSGPEVSFWEQLAVLKAG